MSCRLNPECGLEQGHAGDCSNHKRIEGAASPVAAGMPPGKADSENPGAGEGNPESPVTTGERHYTVLEPIRAGVLDHIAGSLKRRPPEGFRHLWLGDSGMGKTEANRILIEMVRKNGLVTMILTVDDKSAWRSQYESARCVQRINPDDLRRNPPRGGSEDASHIIFRGIATTRVPSDEMSRLPFDVAQMAWGLVRNSQCQVLVNVDELADATNGHQSWSEEDVAQIYRKGRGVGISVVATTQMPQILPREAFGLSDTIGVFRMSSREIEYLYQYRVIPKDEVAAIAALKVGEFRLYRKSQPLDPNVYRFKL